jgi:hypothetical protein
MTPKRGEGTRALAHGYKWLISKELFGGEVGFVDFALRASAKSHPVCNAILPIRHSHRGSYDRLRPCRDIRDVAHRSDLPRHDM